MESIESHRRSAGTSSLPNYKLSSQKVPPKDLNNTSSTSFSRLHSLDLLNIEYDDILHLYRGFRKAEGMLNDKTKEYEQLRRSHTNLQESHAKLLDRMRSLETLKDNTVRLESELYALQSQNESLVRENDELCEVSLQAEDVLRDKSGAEDKLRRQLADTNEELAELQRRFDAMKEDHEAVKSSKIEMSLRVTSLEEEVTSLAEENYVLQRKYRDCRHKLEVCDSDLREASERLQSLSTDITGLISDDRHSNSLRIENRLLKTDICRLLKLLENYPSAHGFLTRWRDSRGMSYIGPIDSSMGRQRIIGIRDRHGAYVGDYPVPHIAEDESANWIPLESSFATQTFIESHPGAIAYDTLLDYLLRINTIFLEREKRVIKRTKAIFRLQIADYKRQLSNLRPYRHIMDDREIRRLRTQVVNSRGKLLKGRPARKSIPSSVKPSYYESIAFKEQNKYAAMYDRLGINSISGNDNDSDDSGLPAVNTRIMDKSLRQRMSTQDITGKSMFETSMKYLPKMKMGKDNKNNVDTTFRSSFVPEDYTAADVEEEFPSEAFLAGALWFGKNVVLLMEKTQDDVQRLKMNLLDELDGREEESSNLLEDMRDGVEDIAMTVGRVLRRSKQHLSGLVSIDPGDTWMFNEFQAKLPLEAEWRSPHGTPSRLTNSSQQPPRKSFSPSFMSNSPILSSRPAADAKSKSSRLLEKRFLDFKYDF